jgi:signal transduction histidine kinase
MQNVYPTLESALPHLGPSQQQAVTAALYENIPEALDFIDASTTRINELSNAVLRLSNLGRCQLRLEPVDMHALVQTTLQTLADQIEEHQGQVTVGPLPEVVADRGAIEQIVGHILDNAVKYAHPGRPLEIEITAEHNHTETFFHVRDNGRGIAEDDVEKVFAPFRRAGRTDVPGQGLGLSTAQTLVRRHGGRMWYESEPGVGATFSFSISDQLEEGVCHP